MEQIENEFTEKLMDNQFTDSIKTNQTYAGKDIIINNIDKEISFSEKQADKQETTKGKVIMLNYFDSETGSYKKLLVKKISNNE